MMPRIDITGLDGAQAIVLHPDHERLQLLLRQLRAIGLSVERAWPDLPSAAIQANVVLYDVDLGHDGQFPWAPGEAPMPMIALVGSEAPGRLEWASRIGADALLMKPLGAEGVRAAPQSRRRNRLAAPAALGAADRGESGQHFGPQGREPGCRLRPAAPDGDGLADDHRSRRRSGDRARAKARRSA